MNTAASSIAKDTGLSPQRLARISDWMKLQVASGRLAGLVTVVARRGQTAFLEVAGQADVARGTPMAKDTIFRIYSMTKPLTSVAIMMLYEQGKLLLSDPVAKHVPEFASQKVLESVDGIDTLHVMETQSQVAKHGRANRAKYCDSDTHDRRVVRCCIRHRHARNCGPVDAVGLYAPAGCIPDGAARVARGCHRNLPHQSCRVVRTPQDEHSGRF